ncbi:MAG: M3 family oligoendopeptidase [Actinomycetota bacterium]|nr:M3 family oligoendopeptidase [Actinomycetota bacterium]
MPAVSISPDTLPRWSASDLYESTGSREFLAAMEQAAADADRLRTVFDDHNIRAIEPRHVTEADGAAADEAIRLFNDGAERSQLLQAYVYSAVSTNSRNEHAQSLLSEVQVLIARSAPLLARLADWIHALDVGSGGPDALASVSSEAAEHAGPLLRLAERSAHQMDEAEESLYAELTNVGSTAWGRLQGDITSQLSINVELPDGTTNLPMPAVRGLATHPDPAVRRAAYDAEMAAWPLVAPSCAAAMNAIKGEANIVNKRRHWESPLDASLFANAVSRPTFDAMQSAVRASLPDFRRWMRTKATLHGSTAGLHWADAVAPLPETPGEISWDEGIAIVRDAFTEYSPQLGIIVDRALDEQWIDAGPRDGKRGGAFCMPFMNGRSLVLLNWSGSADSAQTTAHELGHAYHNTTLADRTPLQRRLPMALAETASIFCETLVVERALARLAGPERLAMLDVDLTGSNQVVVDIHSRFLFETEVFARRQHRTLGVSELNELMLQAQADVYGDGLDQSTAHPHMWVLKPHYYGSHFYNWPYTYGLLFGLGLFARYREDPEQFRAGYETLLSRSGMDTAEGLGAAFGLDVSDESFWTASFDVIRTRIADYERLVADVSN